MTTTDDRKTEAMPAEVPPPEHYGHGDTWADDGPWFVPEYLRPHYAEANPSDALVAGYMAEGVHVEEDVIGEVERIQDAGTLDREPRTVIETVTRRGLVHRTGMAYFPTWLHMHRLTIAQRNHAAAAAQAAREAAYLTCEVCGNRSASVRSLLLPEAVPYAHRVSVAMCSDPDCLFVVQQALTAAHLNRAAERVLPDGRTAGEVAVALAHRLFEE